MCSDFCYATAMRSNSVMHIKRYWLFRISLSVIHHSSPLWAVQWRQWNCKPSWCSALFFLLHYNKAIHTFFLQTIKKTLLVVDISNQYRYFVIFLLCISFSVLLTIFGYVPRSNQYGYFDETKGRWSDRDVKADKESFAIWRHLTFLNASNTSGLVKRYWKRRMLYNSERACRSGRD